MSNIIATGNSALDGIAPMTVVDSSISLQTFDQIIATPIHVRDADIGRPGSPIGGISMLSIPETRVTVAAIRDAYRLNQRDALATLTVYGLSILEKNYTSELRRVKASRSKEFYSGNGRAILSSRYGTTEHFFGKQPIARKEMKIYIEKRFIGCISDNCEYFNLSNSDACQICISLAVARWDALPSDFKQFFDEINTRFDTYAKKFYTF